MKQHAIKDFLLVCVFFPLWGMAQEIQRDSIPEVFVHANRLQIPFSRDNRNVEVLTAEGIKKLPAKSLNEVLAFLNGVDVRQRGPFGTQADLSIDGGTFEQTLLLLNGVKMSDPQTAHHSMNLPVPLEAIERIEVLRGPAARIYGGFFHRFGIQKARGRGQTGRVLPFRRTAWRNLGEKGPSAPSLLQPGKIQRATLQHGFGKRQGLLSGGSVHQ